jgi:hypothetical protein
MAVFWFAVPRIVSSAGLPDIDPEVERLVLLTTSLFVGLIYVLLPLCFVLFYRSEHVAATCRARDPGPSWVDDRPQGLINLVVVYGLVAVTVLMMPAYDFFFPLFGLVLSGAPGAVAWAGVLVLFLWLVKSTMRTEEIAWRVSMVASVLGALSSIVTSVLVPYDRLLQSMGLPEAQRELVRSVWDPGPAAVAVVTGACWLTWIVYVVSVRRYFSNGPER